MQDILKNTFWQLLFLYAIIIFIVSLGLLSKYVLHFEIFALIIAILGSFVIVEKKKEEVNKTFLLTLIFTGAFLTIFFRVIPYLNNDIPLGYDAGIYRYAISHGLENLDYWIRTSV